MVELCFCIANRLFFLWLWYPHCFLFIPSGQATRVWVLGDSIVRHAGMGNPQLQGADVTLWKGLPGARWAGVTNRIRRYLNQNEFPHILIVHLGTNDIFRSHLGDIRARISDNLKAIRQLLPDTVICWSDILQRLVYAGEVSGGAGNRSTRNLNSFARRVLSGMENSHVIRHAGNISSSNPEAYHSDNIHLSEQGKSVFRQNLSDALLAFNRNPRQFAFP